MEEKNKTRPTGSTGPIGKRTERARPCETCAYYDVVDEDGTLGCVVDVDEDEQYRFLTGGGCPYYKFYDEYQSVRKQN
ncbi:MAG: DUF6472 family protein [Eubacteriales bacterium]